MPGHMSNSTIISGHRSALVRIINFGTTVVGVMYEVNSRVKKWPILRTLPSFRCMAVNHLAKLPKISGASYDIGLSFNGGVIHNSRILHNDTTATGLSYILVDSAEEEEEGGGGWMTCYLLHQFCPWMFMGFAMAVFAPNDTSLLTHVVSPS